MDSVSPFLELRSFRRVLISFILKYSLDYHLLWFEFELIGRKYVTWLRSYSFALDVFSYVLMLISVNFLVLRVN